MDNQMPENREILLSVEHLVKWFPVTKWFFEKQRYVKAVDDVSFVVYKGETLGLVGESGCGKSTLARVILQLIKANSGSVEFEGKELCGMKRAQLNTLRKEMQIVFQDPFKSLHPRMTVGKSIGAPLLISRQITDSDKRKKRVVELMECVGLNEAQYDRYPHEFSGGQRQRIVIARALATNPKLVICDEPVSALDVSVRAQVLNLLIKLQQQMQLTYIFISHDLSVVEHICDRVCIMYLGKIVEIGTKEQIFSNPLHPYTQALLSAAPDFDNPTKDRIILEDDIPSPVNPPSGCRFHTRCKYACEECSKREPVLREIEPGHGVCCLRQEQNNL